MVVDHNVGNVARRILSYKQTIIKSSKAGTTKVVKTSL